MTSASGAQRLSGLNRFAGLPLVARSWVPPTGSLFAGRLPRICFPAQRGDSQRGPASRAGRRANPAFAAWFLVWLMALPLAPGTLALAPARAADLEQRLPKPCGRHYNQGFLEAAAGTAADLNAGLRMHGGVCP